MFCKKTQKIGGFFKKAISTLCFWKTTHQKPEIKDQNTSTGFGIWMKKSTISFLAFTFLFSAFGPSLQGAIETFSGYETALAEDTASGGTSEVTKKLGELASLLVNLFTPLVSIEAGMISFLMDNSFILGDGKAAESDGNFKDVHDIGEFLNYIWQIVRDLVNYAFIVVLLFIAFMAVITAGSVGGESSFDVKKILPKFVVAVVLVNFTWFGAKVVLDAATVTANIVYSIPMSLKNADDILKESIQRDCKGVMTTTEDQCYAIILAMRIKADENLDSIKVKKGNLSCEEADTDEKRETCNTIKKDMKDRLDGETLYVYDAGIVELYQKKLKSWKDVGPGTLPGIMAFSVLRTQSFALSAGHEKDILQLSLKAIVALLIMIIILTVFTVLLFVLLERVIILWINIILSPVAVLLWVLKDTPLSYEAEEKNVLGLGAFLQSAFLPALMGVPLIFGFMLIIVGNEANIDLSKGTNATQIIGAESLIDGVHNLQEIFFYIMALGSMWMAMKIASNKTTFVKPVIDGISGGVAGVGKFIAKTPMYWNMIPTATVGGQPGEQASLAGIISGFMSMGRGRQMQAQEEGQRLIGGKSYMDDLSKDAQDYMRDIVIKKGDMGNIYDEIKHSPGDFNRIMNRNSLNTHGETPQKFMKALGELLYKDQLTPAELTELSPAASTPTSFTINNINNFNSASNNADMVQAIINDQRGKTNLSGKGLDYHRSIAEQYLKASSKTYSESLRDTLATELKKEADS